MKKHKALNQKRERRSRRIHARVRGTAVCPRLSVHRSNSHIYAQFIDDEKRITLVGVSSASIKKGSLTEKAVAVAQTLCEGAKKKGIERAVFDRGRFKYHGIIKNIAEAVRKSGITI